MSIADYGKLPTYKGPNTFPPARMAEIVEKIRPFMSYCKAFFLPKLKPWCEYIHEIDAKRKREKISSSGCNLSSTVNASSLQEEEQTSPCYDSFFCSTSYNEQFIYVLTIIALALMIIGVVGHIIYLPSIFKISTRRTGFVFYMPAIALCDLVYMLLGIIIFMKGGIYNSAERQLEAYTNAGVFWVPYGLPVMDLTFQLMTWYFTVALVDRYWYHTDSRYTKMRKRGHFIMNVVIMFVVFFIYTAPKFAEFTVVKEEVNKSSKEVSKVAGYLSTLPQYRILMDWSKLTFELTIPCILVVVFISLVKTHSMLTPKELLKNMECGQPTQSVKKAFEKEKDLQKELLITSLSIWTCIFLALVLLMKIILQVVTQVLINKYELIYAVRYLDLTVVVLFYAMRPLVFIIGNRFTQRYIMRGWLFVNAPPPQLPNEVQYQKCDNGASSADSDIVLSA